jgi:dGTPase
VALKTGEAIKRLLDQLASDLIETTRARVVASGAMSVEEVRGAVVRLAGFSAPAAARSAALKRLLHARLYLHPAIVEDRDRSVHALDELFRHYLDRPWDMPSYFAQQAEREPRHLVVCDYIAGMTDHFLLRQHRELIRASAQAG